MKNLFLMLAFSLVASLSFATNDSNLLLNDVNHYSLIEDYDQVESVDLTTETDIQCSFIIDTTNGEFRPCEIKGTLTITTESGESVSISFAITADSCKEAIAVQNQLLAAFSEE